MANQETTPNTLIAERFRGYYPVIIDVETAGFDAKTDALLEVGAVTLTTDAQGQLILDKEYHHHITPFEGAILHPENLAFNKIDPYHPFRLAVSEREGLKAMFTPIKQQQKQHGCTRCVLVGHNAWFDLSFINAATQRANLKRSPFHPFTSFDTASLSALAFGQTVLAQALKAANIPFDNEKTHSAIYDAVKTAELFCHIVNHFNFPIPARSQTAPEE